MKSYFERLVEKLFFFFVFYSINFVSFATSSSDIEELFSALKGEEKLYVVTVNLNAAQFKDEDHDQMSNLYNAAVKNYDPEGLESVSVGIKKEFLNHSVSSFKNIKQKLNKALEADKAESGIEYDSFIKLSTLLKNIQDDSDKFIQENIKEILLSQQKLSQKRIETFFENCHDFLKALQSESFIIVVMQEALLNYHNNPAGIGSFLPFDEDSYNIFLKNLSGFSEVYKNIFFVPNVIYKEFAEDLTPYEKNFEELAKIKHSYFQTKFIVDRFENLKTSGIPSHAIQNVSFLSWRAYHFSHYQKQYILDSDIPLNYYPKDFYVPGISRHIQNEEWQKLFAIEICQDHIRKAYLEDYNPSSLFHIVQSATIPLERQIFKKKKYTGIVIHADEKLERNEVIPYFLGDEQVIPSDTKEFPQFVFKVWDIQNSLQSIQKQKSEQKITQMLMGMK